MLKWTTATFMVLFSITAVTQQQDQDSGTAAPMGTGTSQPGVQPDATPIVPTEPARTQASDEKVTNAITVDFQKGNDELTDASRRALEDMISQAKQGGRSIERLVIAAWADKPFTDKSNELTKTDQKLADRRVDKLNSFLKDQLNLSADVDTYNMAERSNWLARTLGTRSAEAKKAMTSSSGTEFSHEEFSYFRNQGGPSKAVIVVKKENSMVK